MRKPIIAGNWKMNKTPSEGVALVKELLPLVADAACDVVVCPPFVDLPAVGEALKGSNVHLGAQNIHFAEKLYEHGVPFELHIFGNGGHGMSLCTPLTCYGHEDYPANMAEWFPLCVNWLKSLYHF